MSHWETYCYEMDCPECDEGIFQWGEFDTYCYCDHCSHGINLREMAASYWEDFYMDL